MKCSNCDAELPENSQFCNKCGAKVEIESKESKTNQSSEEYKLEQINPQNSEETIDKTESGHAKNVRRVIIISLIAIFIIFICSYFIYPIIEYHNAASLLDSKNYNQAITIFEKLGDYKDSPAQIKKCKYQQAEGLFNSKKYSEAIKAYTELGTYSDSRNMVLESKYELAKSYITNNSTNYKDAAALFFSIGKYKDSISLLKETQYNLANEYCSTWEYSDAIKLYGKLGTYKDSQSRLTQALYNDAIAKYKSGDFNKAKTEFLKTTQMYQDSKTYLSNIEILLRLQGTWEETETKFQKIFNGWKVSEVCYPNSNKTQVYDFDFTLDNNKLTIVSDDILVLKENKLIENDNLGTHIYNKTSPNKATPKSNPEPSIGMTAEEVRNSQWGEPDEINKTTTASTVHEQWVYPNNKYIYLDNGVVTAIQD